MTNREYRNSLSPSKQTDWDRTYRNHPLYDYIDWDAFLDSEDRNEIHFLNKLDEVRDEYDCRYYILEKYFDEDAGTDYVLAFSVEEHTFYRVSFPVDGIYRFDGDISNADMENILKGYK